MDVIHYDRLVFPQIENISRQAPLVIPLGGTVEHHLQQPLPLETVLLPAIPYGFEAPLELDLAPVIASLLSFLREDGFEDIRLLGPRGYCDLPVLPFVPPALPLQEQTALIPVGHTEQHGFHLPLSTDSLIAGALAGAVERRPLTRLPVWPYGVSTHRRQYPGTLSLDARVFEDFFVNLAERLAPTHRVLYFLNGHGGNHSFLVNVCKFAGERFTEILTGTTFLHTASGEAEAELKRLRQSKVMGHACELETSYIMHLAPELVHMEWAVDEDQFLETPNYRMDWTGEGALILNPPWSDDTRTGTYGCPSRASASKGEAWLRAGAAEVALHLDELHQQFDLRRQRRSQGWTEGAWRELWSARQGDQ